MIMFPMSGYDFRYIGHAARDGKREKAAVEEAARAVELFEANFVSGMFQSNKSTEKSE